MGKTMTRAALLALLAAGVGMSEPAFPAGETPVPPQLKWSWQGPFGTYDRAQLQRGFQVYREVCQACHGIQRVAFRNLAEPGGPEFTRGQVQALAAEYKIKDGPNDSGEMFERPARPADRFPWNFPNEQAAAAANGGNAPPDLSLMAKARTFEASPGSFGTRCASIRRTAPTISPRCSSATRTRRRA
jgi:ubiquinol-cytochrome c reductase cytochrome c1 subunit